MLGHCRDVDFAGDEGDSPVVALELAEFELFVGGLALAVVEVRGDDFVACMFEQVQEAAAVGAA